MVPLSSGTTYSVNGGASTPIAGAYAVIEGGFYNSNSNMHVTTSGPVMAYQGIGGLSPNPSNHEPNQGMFVVPALSCSSKGGINNIPYINRIGNNSHNGGIGIVAEKGVDVLLNGTVLTNPQNTYSPDYVTYRISGLNQNLYEVNSTGELYVSYYTYSNYATSGGFYSGFQSAPEFNFDLDLIALGSCIQNGLVLNATNVSTLDSYDWWYNATQKADSAQWQRITTGANSSSIRPGQVGWYELRGVYSCGGKTESLTSQAIFIGNCPKDTDSDGVVDNLDLDSDNDGILNSEESGGGFVFNLTDTNNPVIPAVTDKNISIPSGYAVTSTVSLAAGSTIVGDANGTLIIEIPASASAESTYTLRFSQPSNIQLSFPDASSRVENEIIKIQTSNPNKTVSLDNVDNTFFVDTNYDGGFESDLKYYTNNVITAKFNPAASGARNVKVRGAEISDITITHLLNNLTDSGKLKMVLSFFNLPINSDAALSNGDSIPDYLDNDSDGDGCSDVIEGGYEDPDKDNLAGTSPLFYDPTSAASSADIRGRVVYSGYDYTLPVRDYDSNGIYDFQEPGLMPGFSSQPLATTVTEGNTARFSISTTNAVSFQWMMDDAPITSNEIFNISADGKTLSVTTVDTSLDGKKFSVLINSDSYLCPSPSIEATLNVLAIPQVPILDRVYSFCFSGLAADVKLVSDLKAAIGRNDINIYDNETGGTPLADTAQLIDGEDYFVSAVNSLGAKVLFVQ